MSPRGNLIERKGAYTRHSPIAARPIFCAVDVAGHAISHHHARFGTVVVVVVVVMACLNVHVSLCSDRGVDRVTAVPVPGQDDDGLVSEIAGRFLAQRLECDTCFAPLPAFFVLQLEVLRGASEHPAFGRASLRNNWTRSGRRTWPYLISVEFIICVTLRELLARRRASSLLENAVRDTFRKRRGNLTLALLYCRVMSGPLHSFSFSVRWSGARRGQYQFLIFASSIRFNCHCGKWSVALPWQQCQDADTGSCSSSPGGPTVGLAIELSGS